MNNIIPPKPSHKNNDTERDFIEWCSLLGFQSMMHKSVMVRHTGCYYSTDKVPMLMCVNGTFLNPGKQDISDMKYVDVPVAPVLFGKGCFGTNVAVENEYERAIKIFEAKNNYMLRYLATSIHTPDDAVKAIKNLPETLRSAIYDDNHRLKKDASLKDLISAVKVLTKNPQYRKVYQDCLEKNNQVYFGNYEDSIENTLGIIKK